MERNSVTNSMKGYRIGSKAIRECNNHSQNTCNKLKDSCNCDNYPNGEDYLSGFSWPPRSYTCSFCKREFRSAQALGGHMNVHRRDRARLRQSPSRDGPYPFINLNLNLSPNPNPIFSISPLVPPSLPSTLTSVVSPSLSPPSYSPSSASPSQMKKWGMDGVLMNPLSRQCSDITKKKIAKSFCGIKEFNGFAEKDVCKLPQKAEFVGLDGEFGVIRDSKEELDLELRLGCS